MSLLTLLSVISVNVDAAGWMCRDAASCPSVPIVFKCQSMNTFQLLDDDSTSSLSCYLHVLVNHVDIVWSRFPVHEHVGGKFLTKCGT